MKDQAGAVIRGGSAGLRKGLVVAQVSLSLLLLIGAGLFLQSLRNLKTSESRLRGQKPARLRCQSDHESLRSQVDRAITIAACATA